MNSRKHALIFFTKVPTPGLTKTRLTIDAGGILTPEEAAEFYRVVMLDTAEVAMQAMKLLNEQKNKGSKDGGDRYDFVVCCTPEKDHPRMKEIFAAAGPWPLPVKLIADRGVNFNEHFHHAFEQLWEQGYESAVAIGGDLPQMTTGNLIQAFEWLHHFGSIHEGLGLVHCPCQACGVSLVGLTRATPMDFEGVFYNTNGVSALDAIIDISRAKGFPVAALETVADIDTVEDLAHALTLARSQEYTSHFQTNILAPKRFLAWAEQEGFQVCTPPNEEHDPRELIDA